MQWAFTLRFPLGHIHHKDPIKLCFEDEETANEWLVTLAKTIRRSSGGELQNRDTGVVLQDMGRKTEDLENEEEMQPSVDTPRSVSRNHSLVHTFLIPSEAAQHILIACIGYCLSLLATSKIIAVDDVMMHSCDRE